MNKKERRDNKLQKMCRKYLNKMKHVAKKHGLQDFVKETIKANKRKECKASEREVEMLARMANDDRINRVDIPPILGIGYRECHEKDLFLNVKRIPNRGSYSRISAELYASDLNRKKNG